MRTLLLGFGNPILTDDRIGCDLARDLGEALAGELDFEVYADCSVGGLNLLDVLNGYDRLVVIDSIKTQGGIPGDWYELTVDALAPTMHLSNIHDANFATALELGRRLGMKLPAAEACHIFAVEVDDNMTFSTSLSPLLVSAYDQILRQLLPSVRNAMETAML
jgi:hydrogenase maturation protease